MADRPLTGPMVIDGNWSGYFMRGDDALNLAGCFRAMSKELLGGSLPKEAAAEWLVGQAEDLERVAR